MLIGTARIDITPPVGTWLVGYLDRASVSETIATPLFARALALRSETATFVLVSCELLAVHSDVVAQVRELVAASSGVDPAAVWITATHTHSGPPSYPTGMINGVEQDYVEHLPRRIARAALDALAALEEGRLAVSTSATDIGENRRRIENGKAVMEPAPGRPLDRAVSVLDVTRPDGTRIAMLVVAACHPVTVGRDNLMVNGDYPGELSRLLEADLGGVVLFAMGAAGDVNPLDGLVPDVAAARRAARSLAGSVRHALATAVPVVDSDIVLKRRVAEFAVSPSMVDRGPAVRPDIEHLVQVAGHSWNEIDQLMDRRHPWAAPRQGDYHLQDRVPGEIAVLRVGPSIIASLPFEVFSAVGLEIKRRSAGSPTIVIGQTNGALGYLAPAEEHPLGGYEIRESCLFYRTRGPLSPQATEQAIDICLELIAEAGA